MTFSYNYFFIIPSQKGKIFGRKKESVQKNIRIRKNLHSLYIFPISNEKNNLYLLCIKCFVFSEVFDRMYKCR